MFLKNVINVRVFNFTTILWESLLQVCLGDFSRIVNIKLVKYRSQSFITQILININGRCDEFTIINSFVFSEIQFFYDVIDFFLTQIHIRVLYDFFQFFDLQKSTTICVYLFKFCLKLLNLIGFEMFDKDIYCCLLKKRLTSVGLHSLKNFFVHFNLFSISRCSFLSLKHISKPGVIQCF